MDFRSEHTNIISLCTGGGGLDLGVELAIPSARSVCLVEREAFSCSQLVSAMQQGLMGQAPIWSDVTTFNGRQWRGVVDGVIGGIPCQPHSFAGKRQGSDDERDLWSDARRIIVQSGAWFALIENVSGMLSAKPGLDPGALRVRRDLQRLGFDVEGGLFTAAEVGASHERERVFILAVANSGREQWGARRTGCSGVLGGRPHDQSSGSGVELADAGGGLVPVERRGSQGRDGVRPAGEILADSNVTVVRGEPPARQQLQLQRDNALGLFPPGPSDISRWRHILERAPELEPSFRRVADGLASRLDTACVDRLRMLGNGVVPLQAAYAIRTLANRLAAGGSTGAVRLVRMMAA
jgi:DNA (cytosine-5)-methyltransferase 1